MKKRKVIFRLCEERKRRGNPEKSRLDCFGFASQRRGKKSGKDGRKKSGKDGRKKSGKDEERRLKARRKSREDEEKESPLASPTRSVSDAAIHFFFVIYEKLGKRNNLQTKTCCECTNSLRAFATQSYLNLR